MTRPDGRHRGGAHNHNRHRVAFISASVIGALISASLLVVIGYAWKNVTDLQNGLHRVHLSAIKPIAPVASGRGASRVHGVAQNILVVGADDRSDLSPQLAHLLHAGHDQTMSTDTMMILHVPADGSKATLISLPRDSYVDIPDGWAKNKLNAAFADGYTGASGTEDEKRAAGMNLLIRTVEKLTGLPINHYVQVDLLGFYDISKAIGGVHIDLCHAVDDSRYSGLQLSAGPHDISGATAVKFVRQRHNVPGGDLGRERRQQYFLASALKTVESAGVLLDPTKLHRLIDSVHKSLYVDDGFDIFAFAEQMSQLTANHITAHTIPTEGGATVNIVGQSSDVEIVNPAKVRAYVRDVLAGKATSKHHHHHHHHAKRPITSRCIN